MKHCILIPDSFKGTLSAIQVCDIMAQAVASVCPDCRITSLPAADGGEGTVDCFLYAQPERCVRVDVDSTGPFGDPIRAYYGRMGNTAVIETAQCAGLLLAEGRLDPAGATTYGVGTVMRKAIEAGCTRLVVGLGGSCTNDGGAGMAAALGVEFRDREGKRFIPTGGTLSRITNIDDSKARTLLEGVQVQAMCDVTNPLYGPEGAAYIFAPQKGAGPAMVQKLDRELRNYSARLAVHFGRDFARIPGSGAAGGMGAGILAFTGGTLRSGIETVLDLVGFDALVADADMVFTGEGRLDSQSLRGKVVQGVARRSKTAGVPVVCVAGSISEGYEAIYDQGVCAAFSIGRRPESFTLARHTSEINLLATMTDLLRFAQAWPRG